MELLNEKELENLKNYIEKNYTEVDYRSGKL